MECCADVNGWGNVSTCSSSLCTDAHHPGRHADDEFEYRCAHRSRLSQLSTLLGSLLALLDARGRSPVLHARSHVILPKALVKYLPKDRLAEEDEWRSLGVQQSPGWWHYEVSSRDLSSTIGRVGHGAPLVCRRSTALTCFGSRSDTRPNRTSCFSSAPRTRTATRPFARYRRLSPSLAPRYPPPSSPETLPSSFALATVPSPRSRYSRRHSQRTTLSPHIVDIPVLAPATLRKRNPSSASPFTFALVLVPHLRSSWSRRLAVLCACISFAYLWVQETAC